MTPSQVDTKFGTGVRTPAIVPADKCVRYALKTVGIEQQTNGHPEVISILIYFWKMWPIFFFIAQIFSQCITHCWGTSWRQIIHKVKIETFIKSQKICRQNFTWKIKKCLSKTKTTAKKIIWLYIFVKNLCVSFLFLKLLLLLLQKFF